MTEENPVIAEIKSQIAENPILLYMKGTPERPMCGFSAKAVQVLIACGCKFAYVNILENPEIRATLPVYADWPTFPQLWVKGELIGGSDILREMYENKELQPILASVSTPEKEDEEYEEGDEGLDDDGFEDDDFDEPEPEDEGYEDEDIRREK